MVSAILRGFTSPKVSSIQPSTLFFAVPFRHLDLDHPAPADDAAAANLEVLVRTGQTFLLLIGALNAREQRRGLFS